LRGVVLTLPVLGLGSWAQHVVGSALQERGEVHVRALGDALRLRIQDASGGLREDLERLCRFDRRANQLAVELRAGYSRDYAARSLAAMARTLGLSRLSVRREPDGELLAESDGLARAADAPGSAVALSDGQLVVRARCELASERLNLVGTRAVALGSAPPEGTTWQLSPSAARPSGQGWNAAFIGGEAGPSLWLRAQLPERPLAAVQAGMAMGIVLAFGLGVALTGRRGEVVQSAEVTALTAIEQATARVARGDLTSHIGVRTGTDADRTLSAFDRMTAELRSTREKLVKAERAAAWQDMARRVAHEIKNPLSPIRTAMETLRKAHARRLPDFDEIFEESSLAILEEVRRLQRIVREFSDFARLPRPRPGAIQLADTAAHAVTVAKQDGVHMTLHSPADLPPVRVDREQITQVLLNLLQNAATAARGARGPDARVELHLSQTTEGVEVRVEDNGPGVPEDQRTQIFEAYFTRSEQGSGLGLTIAARIVEEHGGRLDVGDSPLGGATFHFMLPQAAP